MDSIARHAAHKQWKRRQAQANNMNVFSEWLVDSWLRSKYFCSIWRHFPRRQYQTQTNKRLKRQRLYYYYNGNSHIGRCKFKVVNNKLRLKWKVQIGEFKWNPFFHDEPGDFQYNRTSRSSTMMNPYLSYTFDIALARPAHLRPSCISSSDRWGSLSS